MHMTAHVQVVRVRQTNAAFVRVNEYAIVDICQALRTRLNTGICLLSGKSLDDDVVDTGMAGMVQCFSNYDSEFTY